MAIQFIAIDPRPASKDSQVEALANLKKEGFKIIGFEVTLNWVAELCDQNFDPQHTGGDADTACIEAVLKHVGNHEAAYGDVAMVTVRPDLDSVGGMAVYLAAMQSDLSYMMFHFPGERVELVAEADKFTKGEWKPRPLFEGNDSGVLAPIARFVSDFKIPLEERVVGMLEWLDHGTEPDPKYRESYMAEREQIAGALETGATTVALHQIHNVTTTCDVSVVESQLRAATSIGYAKAPIVVAINPSFSFGGGEPHRKVTICQYGPGYVDLKTVFSALGEGWGGSPTIGGSPQGVDCQTSVDEILEAISNNLK